MRWLSDHVDALCRQIATRVPTWTIRGNDGSPYLSRHSLVRRSWLPKCWPFTSLPSVYLHYFHRGDEDPQLHNHPWPYSVSLILTGGYHEERRVEGKIHSFIYRPGNINIIRRDDYHRVELLDPARGAWTLFLAGFGGRVPDDSWEFWDRQTGVYTPWQEFVKQRPR